MIETENKYSIYPIDWTPGYANEIEAVYQMMKDQEHRIFDLTHYNNGTIMDIVQDTITNDTVLVVTSNSGDIMASFILENAIMFQDIITEVNLHCAIRRKYWGKEARNICNAMIEYLNENLRIKKMIAEVPQCKYGIIKLLKDIGLVNEGTLKECLLYPDKNGNPKWYDKLIYTLTRKDI